MIRVGMVFRRLVVRIIEGLGIISGGDWKFCGR